MSNKILGQRLLLLVIFTIITSLNIVSVMGQKPKELDCEIKIHHNDTMQVYVMSIRRPKENGSCGEVECKQELQWSCNRNQTKKVYKLLHFINESCENATRLLTEVCDVTSSKLSSDYSMEKNYSHLMIGLITLVFMIGIIVVCIYVKKNWSVSVKRKRKNITIESSQSNVSSYSNCALENDLHNQSVRHRIITPLFLQTISATINNNTLQSPCDVLNAIGVDISTQTPNSIGYSSRMPDKDRHTNTQELTVHSNVFEDNLAHFTSTADSVSRLDDASNAQRLGSENCRNPLAIQSRDTSDKGDAQPDGHPTTTNHARNDIGALSSIEMLKLVQRDEDRRVDVSRPDTKNVSNRCAWLARDSIQSIEDAARNGDSSEESELSFHTVSYSSASSLRSESSSGYAGESKTSSRDVDQNI